MRPLLRSAAVVLSIGLVASFAPAGHAQTDRIPDRARDVKPSQTDLRAIHINNAQRRVVLTAKYRGLRPKKRANVKILVDPRPGDRVQYLAFAMRRANGSVVANLQRSTDQQFGGRPIPCRGFAAKWQIKQNRVRISFPQRCMPRNGRVANFKAISGFWDGLHGDYTDMKTVRRGAVAG